MAKKPATPTQEPSFWSQADISAAQAEGKRIKENPESLLPNFAAMRQPDPAFRDYAISALMGIGQGSKAVAEASQLGDPFSAALAGLAAGASQPGPSAVMAQRQQMQNAALLSQFEAMPVDQIAPGLVKKHPEFAGLPLAVVQKLAPMVQRSEGLEQQLQMAMLRLKQHEADLAAKAARDASEKADKDAAKKAGKQLPANQVLALNEGKNVARLLPEVSAALEENAAMFGPVEGRARAANPYDTKGQTVDARMRTAAQAFGKFMEGGVLRKEDEEKYRKMFPQLSDPPDVARNKLAIVQRQLVQKYEDDRNTLGASGYDVSGFEALAAPASVFGGGKDKPKAGGSKFSGNQSAVAIKAAYKAGVLTREEAAAKLAALK